MTRAEAIAVLEVELIPTLSVSARESYMLECWSLDGTDSEFRQLPNHLQTMITEGTYPSDFAASQLDPLVSLGLRWHLEICCNDYLSTKLEEHGHSPAIIVDAEPSLHRCPCCGFFTLRSPGEHDVCGVCLWEDDVLDETTVSPANGCTLLVARTNYRKFGVVRERLQAHKDPDAEKKYLPERST